MTQTKSRIMRRCLVVAATLGWSSVLGMLAARGQSCLTPREPAPAYVNPIKVIVHVPKPEVVFDEDDSKEESCAPREKHCFFKHKARRTAVAAPPTIGMIVAPTAAIVPAPAAVFAAPAALPAACPSGFNAGLGDDSALRAAHELELNLTALSAVRAAQKARMDASDVALQRVTATVAGLRPAAKPTALPAAVGTPNTSPPTLESLAQNVQALGDRVTALQELVETVNRKLHVKYPKEFE